jgi:hypothetical protein
MNDPTKNNFWTHTIVALVAIITTMLVGIFTISNSKPSYAEVQDKIDASISKLEIRMDRKEITDSLRWDVLFNHLQISPKK